MPENRKIIVAHPAQQHSYRLAAALEKNKMLLSYFTTVYYNPRKPLYMLLGCVLGKRNVQKMRSRRCEVFDKKVRQLCQIPGLFFLFLVHADKKGRFAPRFFRFLAARFGKKTARYAIRNQVEAVILYDKCSKSCFQELNKNSSVLKIIDMSSAAVPAVEKLIKEDRANVKEFAASYDCRLRCFSKKLLDDCWKEIRLADYFLVPSDFVKASLLDCGVEEDRIYRVPFGVDSSRFSYNREKILPKKLRFLFAGRLEAAKGIYYLLEAFRRLNRDDVKLILVGSMCGQESLFENYRPYLTYRGLKSPAEMPAVYQQADIFLLPSLYEGFSLSAMEAMASGLPVIISGNSGVSDILTQGREGFTIPAKNTKALMEKILWFCENRSQIPKMGEAARRLSLKYSWDRYESNVLNAITEILNKNQRSSDYDCETGCAPLTPKAEKNMKNFKS